MAPYPRLSFVVATPETKGTAGFASGLVSEINAHTARNAHARKRIARDQARKVANASPARKRQLAAATDFVAPGRQCEVSNDDQAGAIDLAEQIGQTRQDDCTTSMCTDEMTTTAHRIKTAAVFNTSQGELFCRDVSLKSMVCLPVAFSTKEIGLIQFCKRKTGNRAMRFWLIHIRFDLRTTHATGHFRNAQI